MTELANVPAILTDGTLAAATRSTHPAGGTSHTNGGEATSQTVSDQKRN